MDSVGYTLLFCIVVAVVGTATIATMIATFAQRRKQHREKETQEQEWAAMCPYKIESQH